MLAQVPRSGRSQRRRTLSAGLGLGLVWLLLWLMHVVAGCTSPTSSYCWRCQSRCSEGLQCHPQKKRCFDPVEGYVCEDDAGTFGDGSGGSAGSGNAGQSSIGGGGQPPASSNTTAAGSTINGAGAGVGAGAVSSGCGLGACEPEILTPAELPSVCAGDQIKLTLEAECTCDTESSARTLYFTSSNLPAGLSLSLDGVLSGAVEAGDHPFDVHVTIDEQREKERTFNLTANDRCFLLYASENASSGETEVLAHWLGDPGADTSDQLLTAMGGTETGAFSRFGVSPDGRFVALVLVGASGDELHLFRLRGRDVETVAIANLESTQGYVAHAFSEDSNWLALIIAEDEDTEATTLHLIRLRGDSAESIDSADVEYLSGLAWSDIGQILYFGESTVSDQFPRVLEYAFSEQGLLDRTVFSSSRTANADDFQRFVVGEHGFLSVYQSSIFYYDREWGEFIHDPLPRSVSPALDWQVRAYTVGAKLDPLARRFDADPFALAEHCSFVLAWSRDGSKLLCHENWTLYVYDVTSSGGQLEASQLMTPDDFDPASYRVAFSPSGTWLALTPTQQGLVIVPAADFATRALDTRVLERPDGTNEWDFFFTSMEDRLIVQRGRQLQVAQLTPGELNPKLQDFDVKLPPVPDCNRSWFPEPSSWCGSPKFRGNLVLSDREDWLAFASDDGTVQVVNLDTGELISLGKQAESCSDNCVQFQ